MDIANGMSSTTGVERAIIQTEGQKLEDIKFVDDDELMLAVVDDCKPAHDLLRTTVLISFVKPLHDFSESGTGRKLMVLGL